MFATVLLAIAFSASSPAIPPRFEEVTCADASLKDRARCGIVRVPENRAVSGGRKIDISVIVLPAPGGTKRLPPLFDVDGGPGLPSSKNAGFYAFNGVAKDRDVVLVDQRGTGRSNPLLCPELQTRPAEPMLPLDKVAACRAKLEATADLRLYGTRDAIEDLEAVRRALGYEKIDLFGLSYGTTVALRYMHAYPDNVRAALLMGTAPPDALPPQHHATAGARALDLMFADCASDQACNASFPHLRQDLERARAQARAGRAPINDELFMERLRALMYVPASRAALPSIIAKAARGDFAAIVQEKANTGASMIADGMFLAVTCGESFPLMEYEKAAGASRATAFGDYRLRRQSEACSQWPRVELDPEHLELPTRSTASVLMISGGMDPVTPPEWADAVAAALPRSRHLVVAKGGHIPDGLSNFETCLDPLMIAFLDHGDPVRLNAACLAEMKPPPYRTE